MIVEHLVSVGRRNAIERTGHFLTELAERLNLGGLAKAQMLNTQRFNCPLTQFELADALGLTAIHLLTLHNRIVQAAVMLEDLATGIRGCALGSNRCHSGRFPGVLTNDGVGGASRKFARDMRQLLLVR